MHYIRTFKSTSNSLQPYRYLTRSSTHIKINHFRYKLTDVIWRRGWYSCTTVPWYSCTTLPLWDSCGPEDLEDLNKFLTLELYNLGFSHRSVSPGPLKVEGIIYTRCRINHSCHITVQLGFSHRSVSPGPLKVEGIIYTRCRINHSCHITVQLGFSHRSVSPGPLKVEGIIYTRCRINHSCHITVELGIFASIRIAWSAESRGNHLYSLQN